MGYTYDFGITYSYDEVCRFRKSSAVYGTKGVIKPEGGLIQVIVDNYDANLNTLNGKQTTSALAMIVTQAGNVMIMKTHVR